MLSQNQVELWKKIGKVSLDEAIGLVLKHSTRYGRRVTSQSPEKEANRSAGNRAILDDHLRQIAARTSLLSRKKQGVHVSQELMKLRLQREILNAMAKHGDRKLHASELAAALILANGLEAEKLRPFFNNAIRLERGLIAPPFDGTFNRFHQALGKKDNPNVLKRFHDYLDSSPRPVTAIALGSALGLDQSEVSNVTPVLDLAGLVHKLPIDSASDSFVWMHARHAVPEPFWNTGYRILKILCNTSKPISRQEVFRQLVGVVSVTKKTYGSLSSPNTSRIIDRLSEDGLINMSRSQKNPQLTATPQVVKLVWRTQATGKLHPDLKRALLGASSNKQQVSQRKKDRILNEINLHLAHQSNPTLSAATLVRKFRLNMAAETAWLYLNRGKSTLSQFKLPQLAKIADELETEGHADQARYIRRKYLAP